MNEESLPTVTTSSPADEILETAHSRLLEHAESKATADAYRGFDPETPDPLPIEASIESELDTLRPRLERAHADSARDMRNEVTSIDRVVEAHRRGDQVVPDSVPPARIIPVEHVLIAGAAIVETIAIRRSVETLLVLNSGSAEGWSISATVVFVAALCAAMSGAALVEASDEGSPKPPRNDRARLRARARLFALLVVVMAIFAVVARVYRAGLTQAIDNGVGLDASGLTGFVLFQLLFGALALTLGWSHARRMALARRRRQDDWIGQRIDTKHDLDQRLAEIDQHQRSQIDELEGMGARAIEHYRSHLIHAYRDAEGRARWEDRFANSPLFTNTPVPRRQVSPERTSAPREAESDPRPDGNDEVIDLTTPDPSEAMDRAEDAHAPPPGDSAEPGDFVDLFDAVIDPDLSDIDAEGSGTSG